MDYLLHQLLRRSAERHPDGVAVVDGERQLTYGELEGRANQLARLLLDRGVSRGDRVGLYLEKSLESIVGIYGVLKAGAAYVPFDPQAPTSRLGYMAGDCGINVLLTGEEKALSWSELVDGGAPLEGLVVLNGADAEGHAPRGLWVADAGAIDEQPAAAVPERSIDLDLAYVLYTSGSTGNPKGVMLSHRNALTFVDWVVRRFDVGPEDRLSSHAPLHFDLSILDLFAAAGAGARVCLVPPQTSVFPVELARFIEESGITVWYSVPSILTLLTLRGNLAAGSFPKLRTVFFAGEVFPTKHLRRLMHLLPHASFYNLYGPTETNVCTYYEVPQIPEEQEEPIPIGKAIENVEVFAVTEDGRRARPGEIGELYARGTTVMQGYWGDSERTRRSLIPNPFSEAVFEPAYRTGDLVEEQADGDFRLLGRRDHQIKSRGYRIELGDIEAALYAHPDVVECAVVATRDELITNRISAYVVAQRGIGESDLVRFCAERIPRYMIPESFEFVDSLPKTSTGKVNRQSLTPEAARAGSS